MTKISDLDSLPGNLAGNAILPGVQAGTTYGITADQIKTYVGGGGSGTTGSGTTILSGGTAAPILTRDMVYGVPRKLSIVHPGAGYTGVNANDVLLCAHSALIYSEQSGDASRDATKYVARGLAVRITTSGGQVTGLRIVNPGQMYRVGDQLIVTLKKSCYSGTTGTVIAGSGFSECVIKVEEVDPFMTGNINNDYHALGSAAPHIQKAAFFGSEINSGSSFASKNPNNNFGTLNIAAGEYFQMDMDWTAPLFMAHAQSAGTTGNISRVNSVPTTLNTQTKGQDIPVVGYDTLHGFTGTFGQYTSVINLHTFNLACPGLWAIAWKTKVDTTQPSVCSDSYGEVSSSSVDRSEQLLHLDRFIPEFNIGQQKRNGVIITGNGYEVIPSLSRLYYTSETHLITGPLLDVTTSDLTYLDAAVAPQSVAGTTYSGIYDASQNNSHTRVYDVIDKSFLSVYYQQLFHNGYSNGDGALAAYMQNSFFFVNLLDLMPQTAT